MKRWVEVAWAFILIIVAIFCWYGWDSGKNRGLRFGYYGEFNTVSNALARVPDVHILKSWYNDDITLEEFGFKIDQKGRPLDIFFGESDPIRRMSGSDLEKALSELVEKESASQTTN
jgi:hypothetical protein